MNFDTILFEIKESVLWITINRPDKLNALTTLTIRELHDCLHQHKDHADVQVVVITGSGNKAFVAGADISEFSSFSVEQGKKLSQDGHNLLFNYIENYPKPVVAAVNGFALGGGFELALACHIRVASDQARLGFPEVTLGVIPGYGGTQRLAQLCGKGKAFELILTADMIKADEALRLNLVNYVVSADELIQKTTEICQKINLRSPNAIRHAIVAINAGFTDGVNGYACEVEEFGKCFGTAEFAEGVSAFLEKRKPDFKSVAEKAS